MDGERRSAPDAAQRAPGARGTRRDLLRGAGLALLAGVGVTAAPARAAGVEVRRDLAYLEGEGADGVRHRLDAYLPEGKSGFPLLMYVHGGAWRSGKKELYDPIGRVFAGQGIGFVAINYRLSPAVKHPEHVRDVARAFAWLAKHARELGGDPERLYVCGHSAGAHLVALLALDPRYLQAEGLTASRIRGVIGISGPYSLPPRAFPETFGEDPEAHADAFPLRHVTDVPASGLPPFLLLAADADYPGLPLSGQTLRAALEKHGVKAAYHEITDRDHITIVSSIPKGEDPVVRHITGFIKP